MRSLLRASIVTGVLGFVFAACGSRTALVDGEIDVEADAHSDSDVTTNPDAPKSDAPIDRDAPNDTGTDAPLVEGGPLDVKVECNEPKYCDPRDTGYVYQCGVRVFQCSSLEQCKDAKCVNPCVDTLGEDTSNGCEFYSSEMDIVSEPGNSAKGACFAVFIVNQWKTGEPAKIQVDRNNTTLPIEQFARIPVGTGTSIAYTPYNSALGLPRDQIAILFLSRDPAAADGSTSPGALAGCPAGVTPAIVGDAAITGTGIGNAFHIKTNVPVVGYQIYPYGGGRARVTAATLLLPTNVWGTNYIAANAYPASAVSGISDSFPTMTILAQADNTHVTINPVTSILTGGGVPGTPVNVPVTYTIDKGEYLQFTQTSELTGSPIQSDNPVAVIGGQTLMDTPSTQGARADGAEQMLPPVQALGNQYVGVRYRSRVPNNLNPNPASPESVPWRIVGAVDGTTLTFDPPVAGAPTSINSRSFVEFNAPGPFIVSSQDASHPFYFAQYMTGGHDFGPLESSDLGGGEGDPEFVNVITPSQYLPRYTFFTDPTYPETNLVITRVKDATLGAFPNVSLDCAGTLSGWTDIGSSGKYQFTRIDLSHDDFAGVGACNNGVHTIVSNFDGNPVSPTPAFGVTVWGWGSGRTYMGSDESNPASTRWVSYGYPAGANITQLNNLVISAH
ncbi:MAG: IgGFc-binding protein [Polyangiaceae bacterium]